MENIENNYFAQGMQAEILFACLPQKDCSDSPTLLSLLQGCAQIIYPDFNIIFKENPYFSINI